jgi:hypothetical protein
MLQILYLTLLVYLLHCQVRLKLFNLSIPLLLILLLRWSIPLKLTVVIIVIENHLQVVSVTNLVNIRRLSFHNIIHPEYSHWVLRNRYNQILRKLLVIIRLHLLTLRENFLFNFTELLLLFPKQLLLNQTISSNRQLQVPIHHISILLPKQRFCLQLILQQQKPPRIRYFKILLESHLIPLLKRTNYIVVNYTIFEVQLIVFAVIVLDGFLDKWLCFLQVGEKKRVL